MDYCDGSHDHRLALREDALDRDQDQDLNRNPDHGQDQDQDLDPNTDLVSEPDQDLDRDPPATANELDRMIIGWFLVRTHRIETRTKTGTNT